MGRSEGRNAFEFQQHARRAYVEVAFEFKQQTPGFRSRGHRAGLDRRFEAGVLAHRVPIRLVRVAVVVVDEHRIRRFDRLRAVLTNTHKPPTSQKAPNPSTGPDLDHDGMIIS